MKSVSARDSRAPAPSSTANLRAGHLRGALEVENAERRPEIPVRERLEIKLRRLAPCAHHHVVGFALADGHRGMRKIGQRHQQRRSLLLDLIQLDAKLSNLLRPLTIGLQDAARVLALALCARNLVAGRILIALQSFELGNQPAPLVLERRQLFELAVSVHPAILQTAFDVFLVIAHINRVKHGEIVCRTTTT